jgi:hypothetical protein
MFSASTKRTLVLSNSSGISESVFEDTNDRFRTQFSRADLPVNWPVARPVLCGQQDGQSNAEISSAPKWRGHWMQRTTISPSRLPPQRIGQLDCAPLVEQHMCEQV